MTPKAIQYENGYLFVDEQAKIQNMYPHIVLEKLTTGVYELWQVDNIHDIDEENQYEIVAQSPELSIPDIPYVELEEEVANNLAKDYSVETYKHSPFRSMAERAYMEGYKTALQRKAQSKKYSEEDLRKLLMLIKEQYETYPTTFVHRTTGINCTIDEIIQSLQPKIESIELEMPSCGCKDFGLYRHNTPCINKGVCDIPVTYQKDGKTFLKVKQINYATS